MRPLLEITTTPARYEYEVMRARLEISQERASVERTTRRASANMRRQAGRTQLEYAARRSDRTYRAADRTTIGTGTGQGYGAAYSAVGDYAEFGSQRARAYQSAVPNVADTIYGRSMQHSQGDLVLMPLSSAELQYMPAGLTSDFMPGTSATNWNVGLARLDFVPGSFRLNFTQYAQVNIEYVGGFNYVPRSADPDFQALA